MVKKKKGKITVLEAVDTLSHLADLDVEKPQKVEWLDPAKVEENQEVIRETFRTINSYLQHMYKKDREELSRPTTQKGIRSMIQLAGEAVEKMDRYTGLFQGAHAKDASISEFKKLQQFYLSKVFSKLKQEKPEEGWEFEVKPGDEDKQVLQDLDTVRQDRNYDLFYVTLEDGTPLYTSNLLRHLRMVGNIDESFIPVEREDFLSKLDVVMDRDLHLAAAKMLEECSDLIDIFYKEALQHKENETLMQMAKAIMALLLAANPKNLRHNAQGKCTTDYWNDFVLYLRLALETDLYNKWIGESKLSKLEQASLKLLHRMCHTFFLKAFIRSDDLQVVYEIVGKELDPSHSIWTSLAEAENKLQEELIKSPSGPLMKALQMFRHEDEKRGFDPLLQKNTPAQFFTLQTEEMHATVIHMPAPVHQRAIDRGEVTAEFKGYLHSLGDLRHLYVNFMDRTSWKENLRCTLLEDIAHKMHLLTLPKDTDFYHQLKHYGEVLDSKQFCSTCIAQVLGGVENGFYFPEGSTPKKWIEPLVQFIFREIFEAPLKMDRKQKLDFIEILYFFITLIYVTQLKPDVINLSCKDGVDAGAGASGAFYGFLRMLSSKTAWSSSDREALLYALFIPALFIRHRTLDSLRLQRTLSALEHFELAMKAHRKEILHGLSGLLPDLSFSNIKVA